MINDSERREIAARLREQKTWDIFTDFEDFIGDLCDAVFEDEGDLNDIFRLQSALADLIEPEPERTCHVVARYEAMSRSEIGRERIELSCGHIVERHSKFCPKCGAKVVE